MDTQLLPQKKPGRPKKGADTQAIGLRGIINTPENAGDIVELVYANPMLFRKIFTVMKSYEISEVQFDFQPTLLRLYAEDHLKKSSIIATISAKCMNIYYCARPIMVTVKRDSLEHILGNLTRANTKFTIVLNEECRSTMYIVTHDSEYDNADSYDIDILYKEHQDLDLDDSDYPIKFRMSAKHFKSRVNTTRKFSKTISIQKEQGEPLRLTSDKSQLGAAWACTYKDPDRIGLVNTLDDDATLNVTLCVEYIRPFISSGIGDDIYIAVDPIKRVSLTTYLDTPPGDIVDTPWVACIKIYTETKSESQ